MATQATPRDTLGNKLGLPESAPSAPVSLHPTLVKTSHKPTSTAVRITRPVDADAVVGGKRESALTKPETALRKISSGAVTKMLSLDSYSDTAFSVDRTGAILHLTHTVSFGHSFDAVLSGYNAAKAAKVACLAWYYALVIVRYAAWLSVNNWPTPSTITVDLLTECRAILGPKQSS